MTFAEITAPLEPAQFLDGYWTRTAVHLRQPHRTFDGLFGWKAVGAILNAGDITFPKIKVSRSDRPVPTEQFTVEAGGQRLVEGHAVLNLLREGASFGITGADSHWQPLRSVVDCLYDTLLESVHTNVYCSPANTQGFQCHFDLHEVFVLQVDGEKHWRVFQPTSEFPISSWRADAAPHTSSEPYLDVVLGPGDVLYVPRGHWHYATAMDSTSLHVTVGVTCRKGSAFLDWLGGELLKEPAWRRNVPLLSSATTNGTFAVPAGFSEWSRALEQSLSSKLNEPGLFERFCKDSLNAVAPVHNVSMVDEPLPVEQLRFERPPGRRHYFGNGAEGSPQGSPDHLAFTVTVAGAEIQVDGADADLIRKIFNAESFTLADVRTWKSDVVLEEVADLLAELTRSGFLIASRIPNS